MSDDEIENARRAGEEHGKITTEIRSLVRRVTRVENAFLAVLTGAAALWAKSKGFW